MLPEPREAPSRDASPPLEAIVADALPPVTLGLAILYGLLAVAHQLLLPPTLRDFASLAAAASALLLAGVFASARAGRIPRASAQRAGAGVALIALANSVIVLVGLRDPIQTTNFILLVIGAGLLFLSHAWLALVVLTTVVAWGLIALTSPPDPTWSHFGFALLTALVLSVAVHAARLRTFRRLVRQRAEIAAAAERMRAVVESAPIVLLALDRDGRITLLEGKGLATLAADGALSVGVSLLDVAGEAAPFAAHARRALAGESFTSQDVVRGVTFETRWSPARDAAGNVTGALAVATDVSERARADELTELNRYKTQFISAAAHELGTPLTPIKVQVHLLKQSRTLSEPDRKSLSILDRNVSRVVSLVEDLLDVARLQSGRLALSRSKQDLRAILADIVESFREPAKHAGVEIDARLAPDLLVDADGKRIGQVALNLLTNAIKFTPQGGRVHVEARRDGSHAVFEVRDTGVGLTGEQIARLFQPFTQVHDTSALKKGGTGLGLYIARGIVEQHGGAITVASDGPGKGCAFRVSLPMAP